MTTGIYEAFAYAMRYWFIAVAIGILIAMIRISYKEYKSKKQVRTELSRYIGYAEIVGGPDEFIGDKFGLGQVTTIGRSRRADIVLPDETVAGLHCELTFDTRDLIVQPLDGAEIRINRRRAVRPHAIKTGDVISVGDVDLAVYIRKTRVGYEH